ncbi:MAG TPA: aminotransferase class III-fold pyridoxal phosphate-dependent enzyme [Magnetospirillum sp.]|nr:aminotransferase class III-fold pyridoxal phosphate-dependent enzyme [Magnetospirillum sp.]
MSQSESGRGQQLYRRAKELIPGGTQLLSKRPEMFLPDQWPSYYQRAKGAEVWDLDGRRLLDCGYHGIGACALGYGDPDVDAAVIEAIRQGSTCTLNAPEEVALAERMVGLHPWADMARFTRAGGEALAVAIRIARTATRRAVVAFCGYHGWHDWYLAANLGETSALDGHLLPELRPAGVPRPLAGTAVPFHYNKLEELEAIVAEHGDTLAAIVMEPVRSQDPAPGFLEGVRAIADRVGAVLIFDEVTSGWRLSVGGAHLVYGVSPDMAVFAKAISNGYPLGAVIGRRAVMTAAQDTFISSTAWTERVGPVAALATIDKMERLNLPAMLVAAGTKVQRGWQAAADAAGLGIAISGIAPLAHLGFTQGDPLVMKTLFVQEMLDRGFLATTAFYATAAHDDSVLDPYLAAVGEVFAVMAEAFKTGDAEQRLRGPVAHGGFRRLT